LEHQDEDKNTRLIHACLQGRSAIVKALLDKSKDEGVDINKAGDCDRTALIYAAWKGHPQCVKLLIDAKADINKVEHYEETPLYYAAMDGHIECVKLLMDAKADINLADDIGRTALN